ncbi:hypothetical protein GCM10023403_42090 [Pseudonocardia benzenivorans]|jgi:hypothetical protein|uniref:Uncharacterized protein n=1 Tax=Pseudonocardia dioxanivorans (strain ATCC 55486 / DSM 44775 / JCM 13855 / CB1190) TaxID=675635 RepID=F4CT45_PSEUX|nr:hypothetical protein Psed_4100 [Pseudonocardia dioxanivorans CB1190]
MSTSHAAEPTPTPVTDGTPPPAASPAHARGGSVGGPGWAVDSHDGQSTLKLHAAISVMATILCLFVAVVFVYLETIAAAIVFAVIALICIGIFVGCRARLAKVRRSGSGHG